MVSKKKKFFRLPLITGKENEGSPLKIQDHVIRRRNTIKLSKIFRANQGAANASETINEKIQENKVVECNLVFLNKRNDGSRGFVIKGEMHKVCLYISPEAARKYEYENDLMEHNFDSTVPWWMRDRNCNKVIHYKRQNRPKLRKEDELALNTKNLGVTDPEEYDLEQKIDLEIKMREGTTKLLAACKHRTQSLEAAKNLLTSNERMSAYMSELQRRKKEAPSRGLGYSKISKARLSLSDLRMPLIWRDTDHFKNKGDYRRFAVFCLARVGTEIYDTSLLSPVDRSLTDLTFPDVMLFSNITPDFELRLEVYSHILQDDLTMASTSRKIKKTIHSSISRTVGKKLAATLSDELNAGKIGPRFELTATAKLTLDEVHDSIRTHDLEIHTTDTRSHQLPLFGHFCCRLAAQPNAFSQEACSGELSIRFHDAEDTGSWESVWGRLQGFNLETWKERNHFEAGQPAFQKVPVNKNAIIKTGKRSTDILILINNNQTPLATLRFQNVEEQQKWLKCLNQHSEDHRRWKSAAENCLNVMSPGSMRNSFVKGFRQGSLYDQTPIIETIAPEPTSHRRTVQEIFGLTPSTSLSSCASSSSSITFHDRSSSASRRTASNNQRLVPN